MPGRVSSGIVETAIKATDSATQTFWELMFVLLRRESGIRSGHNATYEIQLRPSQGAEQEFGRV